MHQGTFGRAGFLHERTQGVGAVGVAGGSGHQVGLQADVVEDIVGREVGCDCWVGRGGRGYGRAWGRRPRRMRDRRGPCAVRPSTAGSVPAAGTTWPASRFPRPGRVAGTGAYQNTLFRRARSPLRPVALPGCSMGFGGVVGPCAPWWQRTSALSRRCTSAIFSADIGPAQITRLRRTQ